MAEPEPTGSPGKGQATITVVIRCHEQGRFLLDAVTSVNEQSEVPESIVVVNDGSTDETAEVLDGLASNVVPVHVISRSPARGAVASLNDGITAATSDLVCPLDADDRLSPRFLELTRRALARDPRAGWAYGAIQTFGTDHSFTPASSVDVDRLMIENLIPITTLFRRSMFDAVGPFDPSFEAIGFEDWEYWLRAAAAGFMGVPVDGCWLEYRRHPSPSRNDTGHLRASRARARIWMKHRRALRPRHVTGWFALGTRRRWKEKA